MKTKGLNPNLPVELTYVPDFQDSAFVVSGMHDEVLPVASHVESLQATEAPKRRNAIAAGKAVLEAPEQPQDVLPTYQPSTLRTRVKDWLSDAEWRRADRELGLTGTELSIVRERQGQRLANRILVARIAAGVEKPPVWGKYKTALKLAERALSE